MKAIVYTKYGPPEVLRLEQVEKPSPCENEVLIRIHAASVNPLDWRHMRGRPFLVRMMGSGLLRPKYAVLGADMSGRIEAVGADVTLFRPGDEVFGASGSAGGLGAFAEYICLPEEAALTVKPGTLTFAQAAAAPVAALTALQALRDNGKIRSGQNVLINGASGGVGTFAVQIAKSFGAHVTGVCSAANLEMVRSIGADQVIDYTREDFTAGGRRYDLIIDAVGNRRVSDYIRVLSSRGVCVVLGFSSIFFMLNVLFAGSLVSWAGDRKIGLMGARPDKQSMVVIKKLLESGAVAPVVDRSYPLEDLAEALRYLERGHAHGKVVIEIKQDSEI